MTVSHLDRTEGWFLEQSLFEEGGWDGVKWECMLTNMEVFFRLLKVQKSLWVSVML